MGILGGSKNQKSGKCHNCPEKKLTHPGGSRCWGGGGVGVNVSKVREISRTAEKIDTKNVTPTPPLPTGGGGGG